MRTVHIALLLACLALVGGTAWFLFGPAGKSGRPAAPVPESALAARDAGAASSGAALEFAPGSEPARVESKSDSAPVVPATQPGAAVKAGALVVSGRVVDGDGRAVANARVLGVSGGGLEDLGLDEVDEVDLPWLKRHEAKSDAKGLFTLSMPSSSAIRVAVRAAGFAPFDRKVAVAGATNEIGDLKLETGVVLVGRVVDPSGRGVAGASLRRQKIQDGGFFAFGGGSGAEVATTNASGDFRVDQLRSGPWSLLITSENNPDKTEKGETDHPGQVVTNLTIMLEEGFEISGRVTGVTGSALDNLVVRAMQRQSVEGGGEIVGLGAGGMRKTGVGSDGSFTVRGCKKGATYRLNAARAEKGFAMFFGESRTGFVEAKTGERGVALTYKAETALVFQVVDDATGAPLTELSVSAGYQFSMPLLDESRKPVKNFPEGRVRFANLPVRGEGQVGELTVSAPGYAEYRRTDLAPVEGIDNDLGTLRLKRADLVKVSVRQAGSNAPIAAARVTLEKAPAQNGNIQRGSFMVDIEAGEGHDEDGGFHGIGTKKNSGETDKDGLASIATLPGERVLIRVRHADYSEFKSEPIELPKAGDFEYTAKLSVGGTVVVTVVDMKERAVAGVSVERRRSGETLEFRGGMPAKNVTDANGEVRFEHLPAGMNAFKLRAGGGDSMFAMGTGATVRMARSGPPKKDASWSEVEVVEAGTTTLKLIAPERCNVAGRVRESGKALAGARVRLKRKTNSDELGGEEPDLPEMFGGGGAKDDTSGKGEFEILNVEAGDYTLSVTHSSRAMPWSTTITLHEGDNRQDLELPTSIVEGKVTGSDGKPVAGAKVHAEKGSKDEEGGTTVRAISMVMMSDSGDGMTFSSGGDAGGGEVRTDSEGLYRLRGVTPDVDLVVVVETKDTQPAKSESFRVGVDQTHSGVDLVLRQGATIEITCRRADGSPGRNCLIRATREGQAGDAPKTAFTGPEGRTKLTGLEPGTWKLTCQVFGGPGEGEEEPRTVERTVEAKIGTPVPVTFDLP